VFAAKLEARGISNLGRVIARLVPSEARELAEAISFEFQEIATSPR
jgi:hypothetical protein